MYNGKIKIPVTVAIPVKNEARNLARCLQALENFAELVVIDSGSTDGTKEIASRFGAKVIEFNWNGSYPKKRNWFLLNFPQTQPWVLFLDADELVTEQFCDTLKGALDDLLVCGYWLRYTNHFLGRQLRFGIPQRKLALFRVGHALYENTGEADWTSLDMEVHEHPVVHGKVGQISCPLLHMESIGLKKFLEKHLEYAEWECRRYKALMQSGDPGHLTTRQNFKYRYLMKFWFPYVYFIYTYVLCLGFLDGRSGLYYAYYKSWYFQSVRLLILESMPK